MNAAPGKAPSDAAPASPFSGHRFGLERPTGTRQIRGPTGFVLAAMSLLALAAMARTLLA